MITHLNQLPIWSNADPGLDCVPIGTPIYIVSTDGSVDPTPRHLTYPVYGAVDEFALRAVLPFWSPKLITAQICVCGTYHYWILSESRRRSGWLGFITTPESPRLVPGATAVKSRLLKEQYAPSGMYPFLSSKGNATYLPILGTALTPHVVPWCDCPGFKFKKPGKDRICKHLTQLEKFHAQGRLW